MEFLSEIGQTWANPQARHAALIHFPVVLSLLLAAGILLLALRGGRRPATRGSCLLLALALTASALLAKSSGEEAEESVTGALTETGSADLERHEDWGKQVWLFGSGACLALAAGFILTGRGRLVANGLAVLAAAGGAVWVAETAHLGGKLVYVHGAVTGTEAYVPPEPAEGDEADPRAARFRGSVLPLLQARCWDCHNPEKAERSGGLDQTSMAALLAGGDSGPALVAGRPEDSLMMTAVSYEDDFLQMPPIEPLPEEEIEVLRRWITDGAVWAP